MEAAIGRGNGSLEKDRSGTEATTGSRKSKASQAKHLQRMKLAEDERKLQTKPA